MAEWPCCHDPLRSSPSSHRFVPPPTHHLRNPSPWGCAQVLGRILRGKTPDNTVGTAGSATRTARVAVCRNRRQRLGTAGYATRTARAPTRTGSVRAPGVFGGKGTAGSWKNTGRHRRNVRLRYMNRSRSGAPGVFGGNGTAETWIYHGRHGRNGSERPATQPEPLAHRRETAPCVPRACSEARARLQLMEKHRTSPSERPAPLSETVA